MTDDVRKLLEFDGLAEAEKITGRSYKEDAKTLEIGMLLSSKNFAAKDQALRETNDTHYGITFEEALKVYDDLGFYAVHHRSFRGQDCGETYVVLWNPFGILATAETFWGSLLNSSKIYYNILFHPGAVQDRCISSGHFHLDSYDAGKLLWVGDHDGREGLRHNIAILLESGDFQSRWVERPFLWLLTYADTHEPDYDYEAINEAVIAELPEYVRQAITPEEN